MGIWEQPTNIRRIKTPKKEEEEIVVFRMEGYDTRNEKNIDLICTNVKSAKRLYPHVINIKIKEAVVRRKL